MHHELCGALADSQLLEHAAKVLLTDGALDPDERITALRGMFENLDLLFAKSRGWALLRQHGLPGPCTQFLATAAAVRELQIADGGTLYGMPPGTARMFRPDPVPGSRAGQAIGMDDESILRLQAWTQLLTPGAGLPPRCILSPAAMFELCMRTIDVCTAAVRSLDGAQPHCRNGGGDGDGDGGGDGGGVASCGRQGARPSGAEGSSASQTAEARRTNVADLSAEQLRQRHGCCGIAVSAAVSASDALAAKWRQRRGNSQAGGAATQGLFAEAVAATEATSVQDAAGAAADRSRPGTAIEGGAGTTLMSPTADAAPTAAAAEAEAAPAGGVAADAAGVEAPPVPPMRWWKGAVDALSSSVPPQPGAAGGPEVLSEGMAVLVHRLLPDLELPVQLPASPPPQVAAALSAGLVPALERLLNYAHRTEAADVLLDDTRPHCDLLAHLLTWRRFAWLAAYGDPLQTAALVTTLAKAMYALAAELITVQDEVFTSLFQLSVDLVQCGLDWAAARRAVAEAGGGAGCVGGRSSSDAPDQRLLQLLTQALQAWLPRWGIAITLAISRRSLNRSSFTSESLGRDLAQALSGLLNLLKHVFDQLGASTGARNVAECGPRAEQGQGAGSAPAQLPIQADDLRQLVLGQVAVPALLCCQVISLAAGGGFGEFAEVAALLTRFCRQMLAHFPAETRVHWHAAYRAFGCRGQGGSDSNNRCSAGAGVPPACVEAFAAVFGEQGLYPNRPLMQLLAAARDGQ